MRNRLHGGRQSSDDVRLESQSNEPPAHIALWKIMIMLGFLTLAASATYIHLVRTSRTDADFQPGFSPHKTPKEDFKLPEVKFYDESYLGFQNTWQQERVQIMAHLTEFCPHLK